MLFYIYHFHGHQISQNPEDWGVFGDFMGGALNPLLAFFSFMLLLLNLKLQREQLDNAEEQLKLNQEELKLTREELKKAADAQIDAAKVMNEQLKTQALQQFDSFFFNLINQFSSRLDKLVGNEQFYRLYEEVFDSKLQSNRSGRRLILLENEQITNFSVLMYHILKTIDSQFMDYDLKKNYSNILRSLLPQKVQQLLMLGCHKEEFGRDFSEYRELIEKYNFFEHIKFFENDLFKSALLINISTKYEPQAFGRNRSYLKFSSSRHYNFFYRNHHFHNFFYEFLKPYACDKEENKMISSLMLKDFKNTHIYFKFIHDDRYLQKGYICNKEIIDFRIDDNQIHIKTTQDWQVVFLKNEEIFIMKSGIGDMIFFDHLN